MIIEQDVTDRGLAPIDERTAEERAADARRLRMAQHRDPGPCGAEASPEARQEAIRAMAAARGGRWPSGAPRLQSPCGRCGASVGEWCRLGRRRRRLGRLCASRPEA